MICTLHHVQLAMPKGGEDKAREFYTLALGFEELAKPEILRDRGGVWFKAAGAEVHLGIEEPFIPARKAHPAFCVVSLDVMMRHLSNQGIGFRKDVDLPASRRIYVYDPFGNRIELLETI